MLTRGSRGLSPLALIDPPLDSCHSWEKWRSILDSTRSSHRCRKHASESADMRRRSGSGRANLWRSGFDHVPKAGTGESSTSFVFDMNEVFESFLTTRLTEPIQAARRLGCPRKDRRSSRRRISMWGPTSPGTGAEGVRAVVDAKYKSLVESSSMPNADAYQMLGVLHRTGSSTWLSRVRKGCRRGPTHAWDRSARLRDRNPSYRRRTRTRITPGSGRPDR